MFDSMRALKVPWRRGFTLMELLVVIAVIALLLSMLLLALQGLAQGDSARADLQAIIGAAESLATLVQQLLGFARKQTISPRVLDLNHTVAGMLRMLRQLIGVKLLRGAGNSRHARDGTGRGGAGGCRPLRAYPSGIHR